MAGSNRKGARARWVFDTEDLPRLLRESKQYRGESLWQDAWRRLRHIRSAWWSLIFLALFGMTALLAPLLPIPAPTAFTLAGVPQPPIWAGFAQEHPEDWTDALSKLEAGNQPTRKSWLGTFDDGWRHRTVVHLDMPEGEAAGLAEGLADWVATQTGRTPTWQLGEPAEGRVGLFVAIPYERADSTRSLHQPSGRSGHIVASLGLADAQAQLRVASFECQLPVDAARLRSWTSNTQGRTRRLFFEVDAEGEAAGELSYEFRQPRDENWVVVGVRVNGVEIAPDSFARERIEGTPLGSLGGAAALTLPAQLALPQLPLPEAWLTSREDVRIALDGEQDVLLFERLHYEAPEVRGLELAGLGQRLEPLARETLPAGASLAGVKVYDLYDWDTGEAAELSWTSPGDWMRRLDRGLLTLRGRCFGLWQCSNWLGTDSGGRDLFARIIWGSRTSILVALAATLCSLIIGVTYGAFSGLMGGRIDNLMMRFVDILYSVPFIFVVIFLITIVGEYRSELEDLYGIDREVVFYVVIGAIYWLTMARVVRGQVLSLKNSEFVEAARVVGASTFRILFSHLVPNVLSIVIVYLTLTIPAVMLFEAFLSFLGLGIEPPKVSWGLLASDSTEAISSVKTYWWLVAFPALAMGTSLLALNVLGDGLRDALDPKLRGKD